MEKKEQSNIKSRPEVFEGKTSRFTAISTKAIHTWAHAHTHTHRIRELVRVC